MVSLHPLTSASVTGKITTFTGSPEKTQLTWIDVADSAIEKQIDFLFHVDDVEP